MNELKIRLIVEVKNQLTTKLETLNALMNEIISSSGNESKSSAGDKHETSKAMMHLEQEKLGNQIKEIELQINDFNTINFDNTSNTIFNGSLVKTNNGLFFICTSLGKVFINEQPVFVVSNKSPIGIAFISSKKNDAVKFNDITYIINELC
jgi:hypothetical protein